MQSYLIMMAVRLLELNRLLKPTGSIYLHCDPTASHYLKLLMDVVFGPSNFRNEIVWCYRGGGVPKLDFARKHDTILRYGKTKDVTFNTDAVRTAYSEDSAERLRYTARSFRGDKICSSYAQNPKGKHPDDWWVIQPIMPSSKERRGYPTQKPLALLERVIKASSNEGDTVLDPFCGCATALIASEKLNRKWVGIDLSDVAQTLVKLRMREELGLFSLRTVYRDDIPHRTDLGKLPGYKTHKHTLFGQQEGQCVGCLVAFPFRNFTIDHIVARNKGGTDHLDNLQLLCGACNSMKGTRTQEEFLAVLKREGIR